MSEQDKLGGVAFEFGSFEFIQSYVPYLSKVATEFVRQHPSEARIAVLDALEAVAVRFDATHGIPADDLPDALKPYVVRKETGDELIGVSEASARLAVSRTTVYDWIEKKRLVGWRTTKRSTVIPAEQILGPSELVDGIEQVRKIIADPRTAWRFLTEISPFLDEPRRPLDALRAGDLDAVQAAAEAHGEAFA